MTIDGYDVRDVTLASLRRQMGVMLQDTFIFSGNVAREHPLRQARAPPTRKSRRSGEKPCMPRVHHGTARQILRHGGGGRGSTLSAGQRQLIAFRACCSPTRVS